MRKGPTVGHSGKLVAGDAKRNMKTEVITYNATISTRDMGQQWINAVSLLREMVITYNATISTCENVITYNATMPPSAHAKRASNRSQR